MIADKIRIVFLFNALYFSILVAYCLVNGIGFAPSTLTLFGSLAVLYGASVLLTLIGPFAWIGRATMLAILLGWFCLNSSTLQNIRMYDGFMPYDDFFLWVDQFTGYSWAEASQWVSQHPAIATVLYTVYTTSIQQVLLLFVLLTLFRSQHEATRMITTNGLSLMICMIVWCLFPNFGPSAYVQLAPGIADAARIVADNSYGDVMNHAATYGIDTIDLETTIGMVAFPSYHTVLTCLILYFAYAMRPVFWLALPIHLLTLPAILVTGGHLLIDVIGGAIVFVVSLKLADRLLAASLPDTVARFVPGPLQPLKIDPPRRLPAAGTPENS